jgi:hypothetical protein
LISRRSVCVSSIEVAPAFSLRRDSKPLRALACVVNGLLHEARQITGNPAGVEPHLLVLTTPWSE